MFKDILKDKITDPFHDLIGSDYSPSSGYEYVYTIDGDILRTADGKPVLRKK